MKHIRRILVASLLAAPLAMSLSGAAVAQGQPFSIIVPYSAGGSTDAVARMLSEKLKENLGRTVIVENRPGAGGRIALQALKNAPSADSTAVLAFSGVLINSIIYRNAKGYDFQADFKGLAQVGKTVMGVAVPMSSKATTAQEFLANLSRPGVFTYGHNGPGSFSHLVGLRFATQTKLEANPIAYQGGAPMANDLMGGQIEAAIDTSGDFAERHYGKKLRVVGTLGKVRSPLLPDVPTMAEQGIPDVDADLWLGFLANKSMSAEVAERFQDALRKALADPELKEKIGKLVEVDYQPGAGLQKAIDKDAQVWTPIIEAQGLIQP